MHAYDGNNDSILLFSFLCTWVADKVTYNAGMYICISVCTIRNVSYIL